jgi:hypothetical protein
MQFQSCLCLYDFSNKMIKKDIMSLSSVKHNHFSNTRLGQMLPWMPHSTVSNSSCTSVSPAYLYTSSPPAVFSYLNIPMVTTPSSPIVSLTYWIVTQLNWIWTQGFHLSWISALVLKAEQDASESRTFFIQTCILSPSKKNVIREILEQVIKIKWPWLPSFFCHI